MKKEQFKNISIRGRVAFSICCLENAIKYYKLEHLEWEFILSLLWTYTSDKVGKWHYPMAESTPRGVLGETEYLEDLEYLSIRQFRKLESLYNSTNKETNKIIDSIFSIGTYDLYSSIVNNSQNTLNYLQEIIDIMETNKIQLPPIELFEKFPITENNGWGREFTRGEVFKTPSCP